MSEEVVAGLGYSSRPHYMIGCSGNGNGNGNGSGNVHSSQDGNSLAAEALMKNYMQQCLDYHKEQQREHYQEIKKESQDVNYYQQNAAPPTFVPAAPLPGISIPPDDFNKDTTNPANMESNVSSQSLLHQQQKHAITAQQAIANARAIAERLASKTQIPSHVSVPNTAIQQQQHQQNTAPSIKVDYAKKRHDFLTQVHYKRLHTSFLKNLDYIAAKDEESYRLQVEQLNHHTKVGEVMKKREENLLIQRQQQRQRQQQQLNAKLRSVAGIGTGKRSYLEMKKLKEGHLPAYSSSSSREGGVYITGLPTDDSQNNKMNNDQLGKDKKDSTAASYTKEDLEGLIKGLFGAFGNIVRVTLYIDKVTGLRKGDGLVVYCLDDEEGGSVESDGIGELKKKIESFISMVCTQLNGAALPCGSVISVEPANMDYKSSKRHQQKRNKKGTKNQDSNEFKDGYDDKNGSNNDSTAVKEIYNRATVGFARDDQALEKNMSTGSSAIEIKNEVAVEKKVDGEDDDLDDFFASLE